jgi:hypothetical protein
LGIYLIFQLQKSLKNQYLSHSKSKSYQINSIKSYSSRSFQEHRRHIPIPPKFSAMMWFNFQWRNHSIFKNFCTASPNAMKPSQCTPPPQELPKSPRAWSEASRFGRSQKHKQSKTNKLPSFIDRSCYVFRVMEQARYRPFYPVRCMWRIWAKPGKVSPQKFCNGQWNRLNSLLPNTFCNVMVFMIHTMGMWIL